MTAENAPVVVLAESDKHWESRRQFRQDLEDRLRDALRDSETVVVGGEMDGLAVVTHKAWAEVMYQLSLEPLPPVSDHGAEVITHATITVWAVCPRCKIASPILVTIEPELRVDDAGGELRVKAKAKARTHVCGQLTIPSTPEVEGQTSLDLEDIVGERCDVILRYDAEAEVDVYCRLPAGHEGDHDELAAEPEPEGCPWPGCEGEAGHQGAHITAVDDREDGAA